MSDYKASFMMAVPRSPEDILSRDEVLARLLNAEEFTAGNIEIEEGTENAKFAVAYKKSSYAVTIHVTDYEIPSLYTINHNFADEDIEIMEQSEIGLLTEVEFGTDVQEAFHLQLKLLTCLVPEMGGVIDFSAERILSPVWVAMAAQSQVPPSPSYLYSIQAVSGEGGEVWLHTHGLNRCSFTELEVIGTDHEHYQDHATILEAMASRAICEGEMVKEYEATYLAALPNGAAVVGTWLPWDEALAYYDKDVLGGADDRGEGHDGYTGVIHAYPTPEDYESRNCVPLSKLPEDYFTNPLVMISNSETMRMSSLAKERVIYLRMGLQRPGAVAIVKMRLDVDEDKKEQAGTDYEHIWFKVLKLYDDRMDLELTQEPYYVHDLHEGSELTLELDRLTDWLVYLEKHTITPDSAYLLMQ